MIERIMHVFSRAVAYTQVVVDAIDPSVIVSPCASKTFDFGRVSEPELTNFSIPLKLQIGQPSLPVSPHAASQTKQTRCFIYQAVIKQLPSC